MMSSTQPSRTAPLLRLSSICWLSLGAVAALAGCKVEGVEDTIAESALTSENGLAMNGLAMNGFARTGVAMTGLAMNGLAMNGLAMNGLAMNGLAMNGLAMGGLSSTTGLMTTNAGRNIVKYMIKCALPASRQWVAQDQY